MKLRLFIILVCSLFLTNSFAKKTLAEVKERDILYCGVSQGLMGFSHKNSRGEWEGFDVDLCKAVAASVLGSKDKVKFIPLSAKERFSSLLRKEVDVLIRNTTWTLSRDARLRLNFTGVSFYDGQSFLVERDSGIETVKDLANKRICVKDGTTTAFNLLDFFRTKKAKFIPVISESLAETKENFFSGKCDVYTSDASSLASMIAENTDDTKEYIILEEQISKEPLGPVVRENDEEWFDIIKWTLFSLIEAEEQGVTKRNVDSVKNNEDSLPSAKRLLGVEGSTGEDLGLDKSWSYNAIKAVGNYGEIYERNLGRYSKVSIPRGKNRLYNEGGLIYSPPLR